MIDSLYYSVDEFGIGYEKDLITVFSLHVFFSWVKLKSYVHILMFRLSHIDDNLLSLVSLRVGFPV